MSIILNGSAGVTTNSGAVYDGISRGTSVTASGTSVDFTSIPSWVKRITVMFSGVSTSGTSNPLIQIGAGSVTTSGYLGAGGNMTSGVAVQNFTAGFGLWGSANWTAANTLHGGLVITNISGNNWTSFGSFGLSSGGTVGITSGSLSLGGTLDRVRITTVNGTDTFDAGSINIIYE
jgi:hypothetical protein